MAKLQPVRGTRDIFDDDARRFAHVVDSFRSLAHAYGFDEIATPIFEFTEVFKRTLGETSDVVAKEMYSFTDRSGDELTLRPEYTAGIARAYISGGLQQMGTIKLFAHGPMFRHERPQKGRYRQFHQIDAEILGAAEPQADVELIAMAWDLLGKLGIASEVVLHLNTLGDVESRANYREVLVSYFQGHRDKLSDDSRDRLTRNPMRILDSKDEGDRAIVADAPRLGEYLNEPSQAFFDAVKAGLTALNIPFEVDDRLVRGLDYYSHTAFEFITNRLGAQGTVLAGGRYDGLIEQMGGPPTPGVGWAGGIERLGSLATSMPAADRPIVIIPMGEAAEARALILAHDLRLAGVRTEMDYRGNMKKRLTRANRREARLAIILGDDELARNVAAIRDLDSGEQRDVPLKDVVAHASGPGLAVASAVG